MSEHWDWPPLFLAALERSGLVRASARAVGVGRRTAYDKRARDPEFAAAWDAALAPFREGGRRYDRGALATFPKHAALAPLDEISAKVGRYRSTSSKTASAARSTRSPNRSCGACTTVTLRPGGSPARSATRFAS